MSRATWLVALALAFAAGAVVNEWNATRAARAEPAATTRHANAAIEQDRLTSPFLCKMHIHRDTPDAKRAIDELLAIAREYGRFELVAKTATDVADFGFEAKDVSRRGGVTEELLKYALATGDWEDPDAVRPRVRAVSRIIRTQRKPLNAEAAKEVLVALFSAGREIPLPREDVLALADSYAQTAGSGVKFEDFFAHYVVLVKEGHDPAVSAKNLETIVLKLGEISREAAREAARKGKRP